MTTRITSALCVGIFLLLLVSVSEAALFDRGGGFIYDDVLNITWTQDAGLSGTASWDTQVAWADGLSLFDSVRNVTWDDWRMASMSVAGGVPTGSAGSVVGCSLATELACRDNELGYMFYHNLGGTFGDFLTGNQGPFTNIQSDYWSGTQLAPTPSIDAWHATFDGDQFVDGKGLPEFAWAVRDGDVAAVPVPSAMLLMATGLAGLMLFGWRRKSDDPSQEDVAAGPNHQVTQAVQS